MIGRRIIAAAAVMVAAAVPVAACTSRGASVRPDRATTTTVHVEEDSAAWDCHTMGNRVCGPVDDVDAAAAAVTDRQTIVGPGWTCWAENNAAMPEGYEILCR